MALHWVNTLAIVPTGEPIFIVSWELFLLSPIMKFVSIICIKRVLHVRSGMAYGKF